MTLEKRIVALVLVLLLLFSFAGCQKTLNQVIGSEPNFTGTVLEVSEFGLMVEPDEGEDIRRSGDLVSVSLNVEYEDGKTDYSVGDKVTVYYDGSVAESYPLQVTKVYAVLLTEPADRNKETVG